MNDDFNIILGKKIREIRKSKNISLNSLAKKMNVSYQQLQKYETGTNRISAEKLFQIAQIFQIQMQNFFSLCSTQSIKTPMFQTPEQKVIQHFTKLKNDSQKQKLAEIVERIISL